FFQAEDGIRDLIVTGVQTCALPILDPEQSVWEALIGKFPKASIGSLRTVAGAFGFSGDDIEKPCRILSGGEKARLVLAQILYDQIGRASCRERTVCAVGVGALHVRA